MCRRDRLSGHLLFGRERDTMGLMPKKYFIVLILLLSLILSNITVNAHWFFEMSNKNIGTSEDYYGRAMSYGFIPVDNASIESHPDEPAFIQFTLCRLILSLKGLQLENPLKDNINDCTREDFFMIIGQTFSIESDITDKLDEFFDANEVSAEAKPYVCGLINAGIVIGNGDGTLKPKKMISNIESVLISVKLVDFLGDVRQSDSLKTAENISVPDVEYDEITGVMYAGRKLEPKYSEDEPDDYVKPKIVKINVEILNFVTGIYRLALEDEGIILDGRAEYWITWNSPDGTFEELSEDCRSVVFYADLNTADRNAILYVEVNDNFGNNSNERIGGLKGNY